jgi:hypothetical protein
MERSSKIIEFYSEAATDDVGRSLSEIQNWDYENLEDVHNFIQWLFPLEEASAFNWSAPVLTKEDIEIFRDSRELKQNLIKSFDLMLGFYGFQRDDTTITKANNYDERIQNWLDYGNHNYLRITRILKCLCTLGLREYAQSFFKALEGVYNENQDQVGNSYDYWKRAIK